MYIKQKARTVECVLLSKVHSCPETDRVIVINEYNSIYVPVQLQCTINYATYTSTCHWPDCPLKSNTLLAALGQLSVHLFAAAVGLLHHSLVHHWMVGPCSECYQQVLAWQGSLGTCTQADRAPLRRQAT